MYKLNVQKLKKKTVSLKIQALKKILFNSDLDLNQNFFRTVIFSVKY